MRSSLFAYGFRPHFLLAGLAGLLLNIGLAMMVFISLLPAGIYQAVASISHGLWYARSPEIVHSKLMETLVWLRVPGDIVFAAGGLFLATYALRLLFQRREVAVRKPALTPIGE